MKIEIRDVVEKYSTMLLQISFQRTFSKFDSEDIVQEAFIRLMKNCHKIDTEEHLKFWLIKVTINLCNDYNKSFWKKNITELDENQSEFNTEEVNLFKEINKLKPKYRDVIYLFYYQGYKIREISKILKMKENTVSSNLARARESLKIVLEEGGDFNGK